MDIQYPSEGTTMLCHKMQAISQECWVYFLIGSCLAFLFGALSEMKIALLMIFLFGVFAGLVMNGEIKERTDRSLAEQASPEVGKQKTPFESPPASSSATHVGTLGAVLDNGTSAESANAATGTSPQDPKSDSKGRSSSNKHPKQASGTPIPTGPEAVAPPTSSIRSAPESPNTAISPTAQGTPTDSNNLSQDSLAAAPNSRDQSLVAESRPSRKLQKGQETARRQASPKRGEKFSCLDAIFG